MTQHTPVGTTKGPGETAHEFTFVSPDSEQVVKSGEFVYYEATVDGQSRRILARVTHRRPLRLYPDPFLADPTVSPDEVAALVGYTAPTYELFEVTTTVLGYYDENLRDFINPRLPPRSGWPIYLAPDAMLTDVLSEKQAHEVGSAAIGSLLSRGKDAVPITLDVRAITSTHMAIIASTGAGKSYLASVVLEELMSSYNRASVLVVDPHGEYSTLEELMNHPAFRSDDYQPQVRIFRPEDKDDKRRAKNSKDNTVKVRISSLELGDLAYLLPNLSERMYYLLRRAYGSVQRANENRWTLEQLCEQLRALGRGDEDEDDEDGRYAESANAVIWRLESVFKNSAVFDDFEYLELSTLFRPGQCTVLQLNEVDEREQQTVVATLLRRLFMARRETTKGRVAEDDERYLPYPSFVLIEEAHNFAPASGDLVSTRILKQVLSEGRKFGVSVGLISQRPGKLDPDVLSQCNTQFIMRIVNPVDQDRIAGSIETVGRDLLRELPSLSKGQVIVAGSAVNTPVLCRVRQRRTTHGGENIDSPQEWVKYFSETERNRRAREAAPLMPPGRVRGDDLFKDEG
jgi:hypothetical protein